MPEGARTKCTWGACDRVSQVTIGDRFLCFSHFYELAQRRVHDVEEALNSGSDYRFFSPDEQSFLSQVISQATLVAAETKLLDPRLRDDLLSLCTTASLLYKRLLRPPRFRRQVPCVIHTGILSPEVAENCSTLNISHTGACVEVRKPLRVRQTVTLERQDTKTTARATVAWVKELTPSKFALGLAILDQEDFWDLRHSTPTANKPEKVS